MKEVRNLLINGHDLRFLRPVIQYFKNHPCYQVVLDEHPGHVIKDTQKSAELLEKANIIFCEWCLGNAVWYSKNKKKNQVLLIRLHHQELDLHYLNKICWENVDGIIFICQNNMRIFLEKFPTLADKARLIYNLFDCASFDIPKMPGADFNIGFVGLSPKRKAPHIALEIFKQLKTIDKRYTLIFKGKMPWEYDWLWRRPDERQYYEEIFDQIEHSEYRNSIVFENYGDDMPEWYSKIGLLLSTSDHEGSHQAVAEGMASGAIPIIRNWAGADLIYPPKFIFKETNEAVELLLKWKKPDQYTRVAQQAKEYACQNFDQTKILRTYEQLFDQFYQSKLDFQASEIVQEESSHALTGTADCSKGDMTVMHVCYINPGSQDGYRTRVIEETRVLTSAGVRVILACFVHRDYFSRPEQLSAHLSFLQNHTGAYVHLIAVDGFFDISTWLQGCEKIISPIIEIATFYNTQILHSQSIYTTLYTLRANKQIKGKLVFDVHGAAPEEAEMCGEHHTRINALRKGEKEILETADLIVFVSTHMKGYYKDKYNLPFDNSIIIPTCVHSKRFAMTSELRSEKRRQLGFENKFIIVYLGTLSQWQWPEAMFSLFAQLYSQRPDCLFYLLLPNSDHQKAIQYLNNHNLPKDSYLIREAPHNEVVSLIGVADAGLMLRKDHPVNYVSSPTKFGEYMAAGVPVITTKNIGDISEVVQQENLGLVLSFAGDLPVPGSLERILDFIKDAQKNRDIWADRCTNYARTRLDWSFYGTLLQDAYQKLLNGKEGM